MISHSGFVPNSTFTKVQVFSSSRQILVVWSSTTSPGVHCKTAAAACHRLLVCRLLGQEWEASKAICATPLTWLWCWRWTTCGETEEAHFLSIKGSWKQALDRKDISEVLGSHKTHWASQYQDYTEFKEEENKWKNRVTKKSIRSDTLRTRETTGRNVNHALLHVCKQWVLVIKDTDLAPDSSWVWKLCCV